MGIEKEVAALRGAKQVDPAELGGRFKENRRG